MARQAKVNRVQTDGPVVLMDTSEGVVAVAVATSTDNAQRLAVGWNTALDLLAMAVEGRSAEALRYDIECLRSTVRAQARFEA
jgi:hypothetical protein